MGPSLRLVGVVVGEWKIAQCLPGDRPGDQNEPGTLEALRRRRGWRRILVLHLSQLDEVVDIAPAIPSSQWSCGRNRRGGGSPFLDK